MESEQTAERSGRARMTVRPLRDPAAIRALLEPQRAYAAYALAQLAPRLFPLVRCWHAEGQHGEGLVLHSSGGLGEATFTLGEPAAVDAILSLHRGPRQNFATCAPDHLPVLERYFRVAQQQTMLRMVVDEQAFRPPRAPEPLVAGRRLSAADARAVNRLYNTEGSPTFYSAAHIESSHYHGVFSAGRLVAVAGTHVVSPEEGLAVVGNVFTHPRHRGRGLATLATGLTTASVLAAGCRDVALTVDPRNEPAVRAYWALGYREICRLVEAPVMRRDPFGVATFGRRLRAAWRGRGRQVEIV